jgi:hypothetical protein
VKAMLAGWAALLAVSCPAGASFRASDQGVIVAAARIPGLHGASWSTDLSVFNPGLVPAAADFVFLPTGGGDNTAALSQIAHLAPIAPGSTVTVADALENLFGLETAAGAIYFFGSIDGQPGLIAPLLVSASVTTPSIGGPARSIEPGLPFYDEANPKASAIGADRHVLTGLAEDATFRSNVGVFNGSDPSTSIVVSLEFFDSAGASAGAFDLPLPPLAHLQLGRVLSALGHTGRDFSAVAKLVSFTSSSPAPRAYFFAYGVVIANDTNLASFVEPVYPAPEPVDCIFP